VEQAAVPVAAASFTRKRYIEMIVGEKDRRELLNRLYASATGEAPWSRALEFAAGLFESGGSLFGVNDDSRRVLAMDSHCYTPEFMASYFSGEIYANDPRMPYIARVPVGTVFADRTLYDPVEMRRDPRVRQAIDAMGFDEEIAMKVRLPDGNVVGLAFLRSPRDGGHSDDTLRSLRRLAPEIEQACALGYFIERQADTRSALLEAMSCKADGVILMGAGGTITFKNDAAARILAADDGLTCVGMRLLTRRPPETRKLQLLIDQALSAHDGRPSGGQMLVSRRSAKPPYVVRVMPPPPVECFLSSRSIACILLVQDLARDSVSEETLSQLFGLSRREADLAAALVRRGSLERAAAEAAMATNTARNHLRTIFLKTSVNSQVGLVALLGALA
jgi:DNA-binding CsgD family transcriptional regulator/PAS domain-containing protein